ACGCLIRAWARSPCARWPSSRSTTTPTTSSAPRGASPPARADTAAPGRDFAAIPRGRERSAMAKKNKNSKSGREQLVADLNEDLAREYQAIIAYVVYSQVLKGAEYMAIAAELEKHAGEELAHALTLAKQIDYLGGMPTVNPKPVKQTDDTKEMLRADLENENATIRNYRQRVTQ